MDTRYAVLASVVFMAVKSLLDPRRPYELYATSRADLLLWLVGFLVTVLYGVQIGIAASFLASMGQARQPHFIAMPPHRRPSVPSASTDVSPAPSIPAPPQTTAYPHSRNHSPLFPTAASAQAEAAAGSAT